MADNWGEATYSGFFVIDKNDGSTDSGFGVYNHAGGSGSSLPSASKCLFQVREIGSDDGIGKMSLGDRGSPAFAVNWDSHEITLDDNDWTLEGGEGLTFIKDDGDSGGTSTFEFYHADTSSANRLMRLTNNALDLGDGDCSISFSSKKFYLNDTDWEIKTDTGKDITFDVNSGVIVFKSTTTTESAFTFDTVDGDIAMVGKGLKLERSSGGSDPVLEVVGHAQLSKPSTGDPPTLRMADSSSGSYYLWVSTSGVLRIATSAPTSVNQNTHGNAMGP